MAMSSTAGAVIVAGSINVDLIVGVARLPTAGETVLGDRFVQQNGGKSANQAVAASRVGAHVIMLGAVGGDDLGRSALEGLAAEGIDVSACRRLAEEHTGLALIVVDAAGENQIAVAPGANARLDAEVIRGETAQLRPPPGSVCLLGFEVHDDAIVAAAHWASERGLRIILNPAPARPLLAELLATRPILTPNETEASQLTGITDPEAAARELSSRTGAPVIVTLGADGALLWAGGRAQRFPAVAVEPVDTTGAGDALNGILAAELAAGRQLEEALSVAMLGAAISTTQPGAQAGLPTRADIVARLEQAAPGG